MCGSRRPVCLGQHEAVSPQPRAGPHPRPDAPPPRLATGRRRRRFGPQHPASTGQQGLSGTHVNESLDRGLRA